VYPDRYTEKFSQLYGTSHFYRPVYSINAAAK
jgi:hypothetical protein